MGMSAGFSNTVPLGLPLIVRTFGYASLGPITTMIAFNTLILLPTTIILVEIVRGRRDQQSIARVGLAPLANMVRNPVLMSIISGAAWSFTGHGPALPLDRFIELMPAVAAPCALFALGEILAKYKLAGEPAETAAMAVSKLVIHPLLVSLLCTDVFFLDPLTEYGMSRP